MFGKDKSEVTENEYVMERRLDLASGRPNGEDSEAFAGLQTGASEEQWGAPQTKGTVLLVMHRSTTGLLDMARFERPEEARRFLEELISAGMDREAIQCFKAARVDFNVTFRPVVDLAGL